MNRARAGWQSTKSKTVLPAGPTIILEQVVRYEGEPEYVEKIAAVTLRIAELVGYQYSQRQHAVAMAFFEPGNVAVEISTERKYAELTRPRLEAGREDLPAGKLTMTIIPEPKR